MVALLSVCLIAALLALPNLPAHIEKVYGVGHSGPYIKVEPENVTMGPEPAIDQTFTIAIKLYNVTAENVPNGLMGVEIHFTWDSTLIQPVNFTNKIGASGGVLNPTIIYGITPGFYNQTPPGHVSVPPEKAKYYLVAAASTGDAWWGNGTIVEITFKVISQEWWYQSKSCLLELKFTDLCDTVSEPVAHYRENAVYNIRGKNPSPLPLIKVVPSKIIKGPEPVINTTFTLSVKMFNVSPTGLPSPYGIYGLEVKLTWNDTVIKPVSVQKYIGDTLVGVLNEPTFIIEELTSSSYWLVASSLDPAPPWNGTDKKIFDITFQVINQTVEPKPDLFSDLTLAFTDIAMNPDDAFTAVVVPHLKEDGSVEIKAFPSINIYTVTFELTTHEVQIQSDSIILAPENLNFNPAERSISFNIITMADGWCNVTIPKSLLYSDPLDAWIVEVDGEMAIFIASENATHTFLWFEFSPDAHTVKIIGTWAIPEFMPHHLILLFALTLLIILAAKSLHKRKYTNLH